MESQCDRLAAHQMSSDKPQLASAIVVIAAAGNAEKPMAAEASLLRDVKIVCLPSLKDGVRVARRGQNIVRREVDGILPDGGKTYFCLDHSLVHRHVLLPRRSQVTNHKLKELRRLRQALLRQPFAQRRHLLKRPCEGVEAVYPRGHYDGGSAERTGIQVAEDLLFFGFDLSNTFANL